MFESNWPPKCFLFWTQVCESLSLPYRRPRGRVGLGVRRRLAGGGRQNDGERPAEARLWAAGRAGLLPGYQEHLVGTPGACCHHHHVGYILVESEITGYPSWITVTVHRSPVILYLNWGWDPAAFLLSWCTRIGSERLWRRGSWLAAGLRHLHLRFQSAWNGSLSLPISRQGSACFHSRVAEIWRTFSENGISLSFLFLAVASEYTHTYLFRPEHFLSVLLCIFGLLQWPLVFLQLYFVLLHFTVCLNLQGIN